MTRNRREATRMILERLERGPAYPKEISEELDIPISTVNHNLRKVIPSLGLIKQLENGKYADKDFNPQIEMVKHEHNRMKRKLFRSPKPEEMAYLLKVPPAKARDLLYLHVPGYSEPTEEDIKLSNERLWKTINTGLDLPGNNELIDAGIKWIEVRGMDHDILFLNYRRYKEGFNPVDFIRAKEYLREFPEMAPRIIQSRKDDTQYITIEWGDELTQLLPELSRIDPVTGHNMYGPHYPSLFDLIKDKRNDDIDLDYASYAAGIIWGD